MSRSKAPRGQGKATHAGAGSVRVIAGDWRGRRLPVADLPGLRPTPDRVRETVFNWLMPVIDGSRCLDLYAGSGALGFEAASRGARQVWLVERVAQVVAVLQDNVHRLEAAEQVQVHCADVLTWLQRPAPDRFDLVFIDPPYALELIAPTIAALRAHGWLADEAWLYCEWSQEGPAPIAAVPWRIARAGRIAFALYRIHATLPTTVQGD